MSIKSSAAPNTLAELTPERIAEIKDLLRYESSIAFYSSRAKESMLLLVAGVEQLRADLAARQARPEPAESMAESAVRCPDGSMYVMPAGRHRDQAVSGGAVIVTRTVSAWTEVTA
ncbi:hypothetical protein [Streptomyces sp. NBC_01022]|uniref:hypothetical protein n=1 Tax=Streptomyces sp. NBC_01022 TaxID=2903723 RepID=UPI002DDB4B2B|nr:hypothetical protein [Streptomyces sp. NBC_01022]WRZ84797.1 hypothetical protein OG316_33335 [Streptomyces sp. NBC_01022]